MPACSRRLKIVGTLGKCGGSLFSWPLAGGAWTEQTLGPGWDCADWESAADHCSHGRRRWPHGRTNGWARSGMAPKRTNGHRLQIFGRAATAPAAERARNNASRFLDRRFVAVLIAVGRDNFGQSRP